MRTVTLQEVLGYVADLPPDYPFFDGGYAESCPVAKFANDVLGYRGAAFNGTHIRVSDATVGVAEEALTEYVYTIEDKYDIFPVFGGKTEFSITAEEFLRKE